MILPYGHCPGGCDKYGARDVWVFEHNGTYYMHYDAAGNTAWLAALATSRDLVHWKEQGPVLKLGAPGEGRFSQCILWHYLLRWANMAHVLPGDAECHPASRWHPHAPLSHHESSIVCARRTLAETAAGDSFPAAEGTYYSATASPGQIVRQGNEYLQFFSASTYVIAGPEPRYTASVTHSLQRTLSIARTNNLDGPWTVDSKPIVPLSEQVVKQLPLLRGIQSDMVCLHRSHRACPGRRIYRRNLGVLDKRSQPLGSRAQGHRARRQELQMVKTLHRTSIGSPLRQPAGHLLRRVRWR